MARKRQTGPTRSRAYEAETSRLFGDMLSRENAQEGALTDDLLRRSRALTGTATVPRPVAGRMARIEELGIGNGDERNALVRPQFAIPGLEGELANPRDGFVGLRGGPQSQVTPEIALNAMRALRGTQPPPPRPSGTLNIPRIFGGPSDRAVGKLQASVAAGKESFTSPRDRATAAAAAAAGQPVPLTEKERIEQERTRREELRQGAITGRSGSFEQAAEQKKEMADIAFNNKVEVAFIESEIRTAEAGSKNEAETISKLAIQADKYERAGQFNYAKAVLQYKHSRELLQQKARIAAAAANVTKKEAISVTGQDFTKTTTTTPNAPVPAAPVEGAAAGGADLNGDGAVSADEAKFNRISIALRDKKDLISPAQELVLKNELALLKKKLLPETQQGQ